MYPAKALSLQCLCHKFWGNKSRRKLLTIITDFYIGFTLELPFFRSNAQNFVRCNNMYFHFEQQVLIRNKNQDWFLTGWFVKCFFPDDREQFDLSVCFYFQECSSTSELCSHEKNMFSLKSFEEVDLTSLRTKYHSTSEIPVKF